MDNGLSANLKCHNIGAGIANFAQGTSYYKLLTAAVAKNPFVFCQINYLKAAMCNVWSVETFIKHQLLKQLLLSLLRDKLCTCRAFISIEKFCRLLSD